MNKTVKKNEDAKLLEGLCAELEINFEKKREADELIKKIKAKAIEIVSKEPHKFFDGEKSFRVGQIEITMVKSHVYELGGEFDPIAFIRKYPNAVDIKLKHSELKNIALTKYDIDHRELEKMDISYKVVKERA